MRDLRVTSGLLLGLLLAGGYHALDKPPEPTLLSDTQGSLREVVIQYTPGAAPVVGRAYGDFLSALPDEVTVWALCPNAAAFDELCETLESEPCRLRPVITGHAMTFWSRDRWLALARGGDEITLLSPRHEDGALVWPPRAGDSQIGDDLAGALDEVSAERSALLFDGGDFIADDEVVFVSPRVITRNVPHRIATTTQLHRWLERRLNRRVVLLDKAPDHHIGMYLAFTGDGTALVGDPRRASELTGAPNLDTSPETQALFDAVAARCAQLDYRVLRMPVAPGIDGRTYLTPLNALVERRDGRAIAYVPVYRHTPALNAVAAEIWAEAGFDVRAIDCTETYVHFGSLRCLVNVLRRST